MSVPAFEDENIICHDWMNHSINFCILPAIRRSQRVTSAGVYKGLYVNETLKFSDILEIDPNVIVKFSGTN